MEALAWKWILLLVDSSKSGLTPRANRLVRLSEWLGGDETLEDGVVRTEHTLDWSKTFPEIADQFERMAIERDRYRNALEDIANGRFSGSFEAVQLATEALGDA